MYILGANSAGILNKTESFKRKFHFLNLGSSLYRNPKSPGKENLKLMIILSLNVYIKVAVGVDYLQPFTKI